MKLPVLKFLRIDEFPSEVSDWLPTLLGPLNTFMNYVFLALNRGLTFADNFAGQEILLDFTYQSAADFPRLIFCSSKQLPRVLHPGKAIEDGVPIGAVVAWDVTADRQIRIYEIAKVSGAVISALTAGSRYQFTFRVMP